MNAYRGIPRPNPAADKPRDALRDLGNIFKTEVAASSQSLFRGLKARVLERAGDSKLGQEAKAAEIRRMLPAVFALGVIVLLLGVLVGRGGK